MLCPTHFVKKLSRASALAPQASNFRLSFLLFNKLLTEKYFPLFSKKNICSFGIAFNTEMDVKHHWPDPIAH